MAQSEITLQNVNEHFWNMDNVTVIDGDDLHLVFGNSSTKTCPYARFLLMTSDWLAEISKQVDDKLKAFEFPNHDVINRTQLMNDAFPFNKTDIRLLNDCNKQFYFSVATKYLFWCIAIFCALMALLGNSMVLILTFLDKSLKSPIFLLLQSLSAVSIVTITFVFANLFLECQLEEVLGNKSCYVKGFVLEFGRNMILIHLCLLSGLRIFMTIWPLKYQSIVARSFVCRSLVCLYIACIMFLGIMFFLDLTSCNNGRHLYIVVLTGITAIMFLLTIIVSLVHKKLNQLQSQFHRQQSKLASVVIVLYAVIYCPVAIVMEVMYLTCYSDTFIYVLVQWIHEIIQLVLFAANPFLLFIRNDSIRKKILKMCCCKFIKQSSNRDTTISA